MNKKERFAKKILLYNSNKLFLFITISLIIPVLGVIRYSEYTLLIDNKLFNYLFISKTSDRTFSNIFISYIAAYIFYFFQVYMPSIIKNKRAEIILSEEISSEINLIKKIIFIFGIMNLSKHSKCNINNNKIYIKELQGEHTYISCYTHILSCENMFDDLSNIQHNIVHNPIFSQLDINIVEIFSNISIESLKKIFKNYNYLSEESESEASKIIYNIDFNIEKLMRYPHFKNTISFSVPQKELESIYDSYYECDKRNCKIAFTEYNYKCKIKIIDEN